MKSQNYYYCCRQNLLFPSKLFPFPFACLSVCQSVSLSVCLSTISVCPSVTHRFRGIKNNVSELQKKKIRKTVFFFLIFFFICSYCTIRRVVSALWESPTAASMMDRNRNRNTLKCILLFKHADNSMRTVENNVFHIFLLSNQKQEPWSLDS